VDVDVDLIGWVGVVLGGTYDCSCGILYAAMLGGSISTTNVKTSCKLCVSMIGNYCCAD